ncbi:hypothetical protein [Actinomyces sp. ZJ308]|uniref:hypothetical protein n=1 Tax=Actinomyces sp. ZJ308 TaxID=2708342 RepID=UPI00141E5530|nr:hypothetical protein [Actinomyces sp. ZJ308]
MAPNTGRVVNTLIGLLTVAVVGLSVVPWLVPRIQEAVRDKPDSDLVLAAVKEHQAVLDAEWTDTEATTGASPPMRTEETIRDGREQLTQDGIPVTSAMSRVRRIRATFQDDGSVHVTAEVSTSKTYADGSGTTSVETDRHSLVLTGNDARGYAVVSDEVVDPARPSPPDDIRHRADLMALGVSIVFAFIAVGGMVLSWRGRAHSPRSLSWFSFGGTFALAVGLVWMYTVGNARIQDDYRDGTLSCNGERLASLDSRLSLFFSHDCVVQSRIDVLAALLTAVIIVLIEYRILLGLRLRALRSVVSPSISTKNS